MGSISYVLTAIVALFLISKILLSDARNPCTTVNLDKDGSPLITEALYNCSLRMNGPLLPASYANGSEPVSVSVQIVLNNLISIDEIRGVVQLDIFFRFSWVDYRWDIPDLWKYVKTPMMQQGFDILPLITDSSNPLRIWIPELMFQEAIEFNSLATTFKLQVI